MADNTLATDDGSNDDPAAPEETELVVELRHLGIVRAQLDGSPHPVKVGKTDEHRRLGLARLHDLTGLAERARAIRERHRENPAVAGSTDIEAVLFDLREYFASRFHGWVPVLGKNRNVDTVAPFPGGGRHPLNLVDPEPLAVGRLPARPAPAGTGVRVALVDTSVFDHERLEAHHLRGELRDPAEASTPREPWEGHATFVADLILQQAPSAELVLQTALPGGRTNSWALACLLADLADSGVDIVSLSLGAQTPDGQPPLVISRAVDVLSPAMVIVAAAGNIDPEGGFHQPAPVWPAALPDVIAVGARGAAFSPDVPWVDLVAPGVDVAAAYPVGFVLLSTSSIGDFRDGAAVWSGTSFAAATVTGRIAALSSPGGAGQAAEALLAAGTKDPVVTPFVLAG